MESDRGYISVGDIMTKNVFTVTPETPLLEASELLLRHNFNGIPVVSSENKVIGIMTQYDLLSRGTEIHLPTFIKMFGDMPLNKKEGDYGLKGKFDDILSFTVKDVMNNEPLTIKESASVADIVREFSEHHRVNPIPVVDVNGILVGIVSRYDIIQFYAKMLE